MKKSAVITVNGKAVHVPLTDERCTVCGDVRVTGDSWYGLRDLWYDKDGNYFPHTVGCSQCGQYHNWVRLHNVAWKDSTLFNVSMKTSDTWTKEMLQGLTTVVNILPPPVEHMMKHKVSDIVDSFVKELRQRVAVEAFLNESTSRTLTGCNVYLDLDQQLAFEIAKRLKTLRVSVWVKRLDDFGDFSHFVRL